MQRRTEAHQKESIEECRPGDYLNVRSKKKLANRLARIHGHINSVKSMVLARRPADEILLQIVAVKAALNKVSSTLLEHELGICMNGCMPGTREERLDKVTKVLATLLKQS